MNSILGLYIEQERRDRLLSNAKTKDERAAIRSQFPGLDKRLARAAIDSLEIPSENDPGRYDPDEMQCPWNIARARAAWNDDDFPGWLYLVGETGAGKSWAAALLATEYIRDDPEDINLWPTGEDEYGFMDGPRFITGSSLKDILADFRDAEKKSAFIRDLANASLLVIDDLFHRNSGPFVENFRRIISERPPYSRTIITSQFTPVEAAIAAGGTDYARGMEAVTRRLAERCTFIDFTTESPEPEVNF